MGEPLDFEMIAASLTNRFPCCLHVFSFLLAYRNGAATNAINDETTLILSTGSTKMPVIPSNLPGIMFSRIWSRGRTNQLRTKQDLIS